jgi:hypothetical protein
MPCPWVLHCHEQHRSLGKALWSLVSGFGATVVADHTFQEAHTSTIVIVGDMNLKPEPQLEGQWSEALINGISFPWWRENCLAAEYIQCNKSELFSRVESFQGFR